MDNKMRRRSDLENKEDDAKKHLNFFYKHEQKLTYLFIVAVVLPGAGYIGWKIAEFISILTTNF